MSYHLEHLPGALAIALEPQQTLIGATAAGKTELGRNMVPTLNHNPRSPSQNRRWYLINSVGATQVEKRRLEPLPIKGYWRQKELMHRLTVAQGVQLKPNINQEASPLTTLFNPRGARARGYDRATRGKYNALRRR